MMFMPKQDKFFAVFWPHKKHLDPKHIRGMDVDGGQPEGPEIHPKEMSKRNVITSDAKDVGYIGCFEIMLSCTPGVFWIKLRMV